MGDEGAARGPGGAAGAGGRPLIGAAFERWKRRRAAGDAALAGRLAVPIQSLPRLAAAPWPESESELRQVSLAHDVDAQCLGDVLWQAISYRDPPPDLSSGRTSGGHDDSGPDRPLDVGPGPVPDGV